MGYRNYLYVVNKRKANKVRKMTKEELWNFIEEEPFEPDEVPCASDILDKLEAETAFELGKYIDYDDRLYPHLVPFFKDRYVHEYNNDDCELMLAEPAILYELVIIFKEKIQANYEDLLSEESKDKFDKRTHYQRLVDDVSSHLMWLSTLGKLPNNKYSLGGGWLYEHEIFSLLHIIRIFNPRTQYLIYRGF